MDRSVYSHEITAVLPRVLASFDADPLSPSYGLGDRLYWAWKLIDYANATPQSAVHGLALLAASARLPPGASKRSVVARIDNAIQATARITDRDGSLVEAFPNEKSFCVTALIAYDILCAAEFLQSCIDTDQLARWRAVAEPMINFLLKNDETHALISNHLATAAAALSRWGDLGDARSQKTSRDLVARILQHQSPEGWFSEYGGFDPGYETLGLSYLADIYLRHPDSALKSALSRSLEFLLHAAHPDGSFGGIYGSRNTRFVIPGGIETLAGTFPAAAALAQFARRAIAGRTVPTLSVMDAPNLAPVFNSYCRALCTEGPIAAALPLPCEGDATWRRHYPRAGLLIDKGPHHYTVISTHKGGVVTHACDGALVLDAGVAARRGNAICTSQAFNTSNKVILNDDTLVVTAPMVWTNSERLTPIKMIALRILCLTVFRWRPIGERVKRILVRRLITGQRYARVANCRTITLGHGLTIVDDFTDQAPLERVRDPGRFHAIHMASSGYWQIGDDRL